MPTEEQLEAQLQATAREAAAHYAALDAALHAERVKARKEWRKAYASSEARKAWRREYAKRPAVRRRRSQLRQQKQNHRTPSPHTLTVNPCSSEGGAAVNLDQTRRGGPEPIAPDCSIL